MRVETQSMCEVLGTEIGASVFTHGVVMVKGLHLRQGWAQVNQAWRTQVGQVDFPGSTVIIS